VNRVVMEATSDYWKPPFYLLEAYGFEVVAGQRQRCQAPARRPKTDRLGRGVAVQGR
jgi:transposase